MTTASLPTASPPLFFKFGTGLLKKGDEQSSKMYLEPSIDTLPTKPRSQEYKDC